MRISLVNPESYNPLEVLDTWRRIAASMKDPVPDSFVCEDFLRALLDDHRSVAFGEITWAQDLCDKTSRIRHDPRLLTPIDFTADSAGQMWGLSFTHEKGEEKIFATTITLLCAVPQHQPPMRAVNANQLWIDMERQEIPLGTSDTFRLQITEKLLKLLNANVLEDDLHLAERRFTHDGSIDLMQIAVQPYVQPLIKLVERKLNQ